MRDLLGCKAWGYHKAPSTASRFRSGYPRLRVSRRPGLIGVTEQGEPPGLRQQEDSRQHEQGDDDEVDRWRNVAARRRDEGRRHDRSGPTEDHVAEVVSD